MHQKVIAFLILTVTIVNCEKLLVKNFGKDVDKNPLHKRSLQYDYRSGYPLKPQFWPDNHHYHHAGHRNYGNSLWGLVTTTTDNPRGYKRNNYDINAVTEPDNLSSETTMGVYISSAERNARKYEINNNNRDRNAFSKKKAEITNDNSRNIGIDVRFQTEQSNHQTTTEQSKIESSSTTEGFTTTTFGASKSSDDIDKITENIPVPDDAGRHIVTVPKRCPTDKSGNCRKTW